MNGVNINHFQFEYDLTWMSFFQNHEGRTYTRYGGREDTAAESHVNKTSLIATMKKAMELHKSGTLKPISKYDPLPESIAIADDLPGVKKLQARRKESCIHCHEVKAFQLKVLRTDNKLTKSMVFTYPSPKTLGIAIDSKDQTLIKSVVEKSPAAKAGLQPNDRIQQVDNQSVFTFADTTRVLDLAPTGAAQLSIRIKREGKSIDTKLELADGWKTTGDPSWRESTHVVGPNSGFWGKRLTSTQRKSNNIDEGKLGLRITVIWGQWTREAKLRNGDIIVSIDGKTDDFGIKQLQTYLQMNRNWGDSVVFKVLRNGKPVSLTMNLPKTPTE